MGCTSSSQQGTTEEVPEKYTAESPQPEVKNHEHPVSESPTTPIPDKSRQVASPSPSTANNKGFTAFKGLKIGSLILCKDEFVSKYTGERMCRWRKSEVRAIELDDRSRVLIHYCEWSDNFDFWLDLHTQFNKLAPIDLLSKNQCDLGLALDDEQIRITFHYVLTGKHYKRNPPALIDTMFVNGVGNNTHSPPKSHETADSESVNGVHKTPGSATKGRPLSARNGGILDGSNHGSTHGSDGGSVNDSVNGSTRFNNNNSIGGKDSKAPHPTAPIPTYVVDELLDIQDIFCKKGTNTPTYKWRKAKVVKVMEDRQSIRIHYLNWDSKFDETLHVVKAAHRISPINTMTSTPELSKQQNKITFPAAAVASSGGIAFGNNNKKFNDDSNHGPPNSSPALSNGKVPTAPKTASGTAATATAPAKKKKAHNYLKWFNVRRTVFEGGEGEESYDFDDDLEQAQAASLSQLEAEEAEAVAEAEAYERSQQEAHAAQHHEGGEDEMTEEEIAEEEKKVVAIERLFLSHMDKMGLHVVVSEGDGNCLFRSVSHQLYMTEDYHEELRAKCVQHQMQHKERFEMFCSTNFDDHIKEMSQLGCWGDDLEIRALEEITDRIICIYSSDCAHSYYHDKSVAELEEIWRKQSHMNGKHKLDDIVSAPIKQNFEEDALLKGVSPLCLSYHGQNHYNSVYNEKIPLPLNMRKSRVLLKARMALFDCDVVAKPVSPNRGKGIKKTANGTATNSSRPPTAERPSSGNHNNGNTTSNGHQLGSASSGNNSAHQPPSRSNSENSREGNLLDSSGSSSQDHTFLDEQYRRHMQFMSSSSGNMFRK